MTYSPSTSQETTTDDKIFEGEHVTLSNEPKYLRRLKPRNKKQKLTIFQENLLDLMKRPPLQICSEDINPDKKILTLIFS